MKTCYRNAQQFKITCSCNSWIRIIRTSYITTQCKHKYKLFCCKEARLIRHYLGLRKRNLGTITMKHIFLFRNWGRMTPNIMLLSWKVTYFSLIHVLYVPNVLLKLFERWGVSILLKNLNVLSGFVYLILCMPFEYYCLNYSVKTNRNICYNTLYSFYITFKHYLRGCGLVLFYSPNYAEVPC